MPEKVAKVWAEEWAKEGKKVDWQRLMPPRGYVTLPRRWVVERTFSLGFLRTGGWAYGLREAVRQRRSVRRVRSHDSSDGEEAGTWLRISKQFLRALR